MSDFRLVIVVEQVEPVERKLRYRLIETNMTSDGPRSRLCDGRYETLAEAQAGAVKRRELP